MAILPATPARAFPIRAAMACVSALALAACQTSPYSAEGEPAVVAAQPNFPIRQNSAAPLAQAPAAPVVATPPPPATELAPPPTRGEVRSTILPPPSAAQPPRQAAPAPAFRPPAPPPPRLTAAGSVVDAEGPSRTYVVKPGQGLDAVARELGTSRAVLAAANDLKPPYNLKVGQRIKGPPTRGKAYVVSAGDTLYAIARRFNVTPAALAASNDIRLNDTIRPNQRLLLPQGFRDTGPTLVAQSAGAPAVSPTQAPPPSTTQYARPPQTPPAAQPSTPPPPASPQVAVQPPTPAAPGIIESSPTPTAAQIRAAGAGRFIWPLRGRILDAFGPKPGNQKNDGLNIGAAMSQSVRAAAAGEVVYAGSEVPEFGNLVLIKHDNGFVTAYGHLARILVRMQEKVAQNQEIGEAGQSGGVTQPQLHFEIRYAPRPSDRPTPFDPTLVLPE